MMLLKTAAKRRRKSEGQLPSGRVGAAALTTPYLLEPFVPAATFCRIVESNA